MGFSRSRVGLKWDVDAMYSSHQYVLVCLKFWDTNGQFKGEHDDQPSWIWGVHNGNMRMLSKRTAPRSPRCCVWWWRWWSPPWASSRNPPYSSGGGDWKGHGHGDSGVPGWKVEFCRSGFGFGRINLASSLSFQRTVVSSINPPTPRTDLKRSLSHLPLSK